MADLFVSGGIVTALEAAPAAVGRLDAALAGNPLRRAWTFWGELDAARRHAGADGRRVDLFRLAAHLHRPPLRLGGTPPPPPPCRSASATPPPRPSAAARSPASTTRSTCAPGWRRRIRNR